MDTKFLQLFIAIGQLSTSLAYPETECGTGPHDLIVGERQEGDEELITIHKTILSYQYLEKPMDIEWPFNHQPSDKTITRIEVLDHMRDGKGGCAFILSGGVGSHDVKLRLKTLDWGKFDFAITIYGKSMKTSNNEKPEEKV